MNVLNSYQNNKFLSDYEMSKRFVNNTYEKDEIDLINCIPNIKKFAVIELGGGLGVTSTIVNKKLYNKEDHIVVEANPNILPYLKYNKFVNNCEFKIFPGIVGNNNVFYSYDKIIAGSSHRKDNREKNKKKHLVTNIKYKDFLKIYNLNPDLCIVDIEGGELEFLQHLYLFKKLKYLVLEIHEGLMYTGFKKECIDVIKKHNGKLIRHLGYTYLFYF